ncbi:MAG: DUF4843 domain-containing protein [Odoribacter sp.]|nr:DUF4843 domain-containing protein [Odoribacter sp.]
MIHKIITYIAVLFLASVILTGCEEKVVHKFDDDASLYFYRDRYTANSKGVLQYDSIGYSFFLAGSAQQTEIWLQLNLTGNVSDAPRSFSLVQTNVDEEGAAVAGVHYVPFDDARIKEQLVLPAHATMVTIPVILTRTESMDDHSFRLALAIAPNDHFVEGIKQGNYGQHSFVINVTAEAIQPPTWDSNYGYTFGTWGKVKMGFLIDEVKFTDFETDMGNLEARYYWNLKAKETLARYEAEHGELYEEDNVTKVTFP